MERLTISLDNKLGQALDQLHEHSGESKANLVRRALRSYMRQHRSGSRPTEYDLRVWTEMLANREHVILDVAHVRLLFSHCMNAGEEFWDELYEIGVEHGRQYQDRMMRSVPDVLKLIESANWFHISPDSERSWSLIFTEPSAKPFVATFLKGVFNEFPTGIEVLEERTKLRVRMTSPPPVRQDPPYA